MADNEISPVSATLNERLLSDSERGEIQGSPAMSATRKKVFLALLATVGVACIVVGAVAASGAFNHSSSSGSSSSSSSSFSVVSESVLQRRPTFSAPVGSLANAPEPTIVESNAETEKAVFSFHHSSTTAQGQESHTRLHYTVSKRRNAHCPAKHESVLAIDCLPTRIRISFTNATKALAYASQWVNGSILMLRREWGCGSHVRQLTSSPHVTGRFIFVNTVNTTLAQVFQHANISFFTNHSGPEGPVVLQTTSNNSPLHSSHRRRSLWDDIGNFFGSVANAATDLVQLAVTGDLNQEFTPFSAQYTVPSTTLQESDDYGSVSVTYGGSLTLNTDIQLNIQDYSLSNFVASATGSLTASANAQLSASAQYSRSKQQALTSSFTVASGSIPVFGVDIPVNLLLQVFGGYQVNAAAQGSLSGTATATGSATAAVIYTSANGISTSGNAQLSGQLSYAQPQYQVQAEALAFLAPQFFLQVAYIGGPTATLVAYADASLPDNSCTVTQNVGTEVDVGAKIDINLPHIYQYSASTPQATVYGPSILWTGSEAVC